MADDDCLTIRFAVPLPGGRRHAEVVVPADLETADWEMVDATVRVYLRRLGKVRQEEQRRFPGSG